MKPSSTPRIILLFFFALFETYSSFAQTPESIWAGYVANPYNHPNIPNNSYAGYGTGIVSIPTPAYTVYNVTSAPFNAIPNDAIDDQPAIQAAIDAAGVAGSGIVFIPAGTYYLNKPLYIKYNNVIVRGQGSTGGTATILDFRFSMYSMFKAEIDADLAGGGVGGPGLWWATGLVWIGPANSFKPSGAPDMFLDYEHWRSTSTLATVTAASSAGGFTITVDNAASLSVGQRFLLRYQMPSNNSLIKEIHGHAPTAAGIDNTSTIGDCTNIKAPGEQYFYWPAVIQSISGNAITLDRPLRIKVDPAVWATTLRNINGLVTESGVEDLQILGHNATTMGHLVTPTSNATSGGASLGGWNGLYINRSWNCWANNIRFVNLECGVIFSAAKNCSALNTYITSANTTGPSTVAANHWYHHPYAYRVYSSDNLVENFTIDGPGDVRHGINAEWYSSGNVYSKGLMKVGTFDSHRGSAFDMIRTEITVANNAGSAPGGAATSGPFAGKRFAHWKITQQLQAGYPYANGGSRNGEDVYEILQFPMGALVAITGSRNTSTGEFVPPPVSGTDIGMVEAGAITDLSLTNLYQAELALRVSTTLPIRLISFEAAKTTDSKALIRWVVAEAEKGDKFSLQWSNNGNSFQEINYQDINIQQTNYQYLHAVPEWNVSNYYRLKITNAAGKVYYSQIRRLSTNNQQPSSFELYPNPVIDKVTISMNDPRSGDLKFVRIINGSGQIIRRINAASLQSRQLDIDMGNFSTGPYCIEVVSENGTNRKMFFKK